jgi:hypothetical protein
MTFKLANLAIRFAKDVLQIVFCIFSVPEHLERRPVDPGGMTANKFPEGIAVPRASTGNQSFFGEYDLRRYHDGSSLQLI